MSDSERVLVYARVRPQIISDSENNDNLGTESTCIKECNTQIGSVIIDSGDNNAKEFAFDGVMAPQSSQDDVYNSIAKPIVQSVIDGYNGTLMCYGQTGSGKTHTMVGPDKDTSRRGIIPRSLAHIFDDLELPSVQDYKVSISYLQIYREYIFDLLEPENSDLTIKEGKNGVYVDGLKSFQAASATDCLRLLEHGDHNRIVASTRMNAHSSRSHAVFIIKVEQKRSDRSKMTSILHCVDLAGSERIKTSGVNHLRLSELKFINLSLTSLRCCILALSKKDKHVPFRDSKLTRLLQDSLGGNTKTALIVNVSPLNVHAKESIISLRFASTAMKVPVNAKINEELDYKDLYMKALSKQDKLQNRIENLTRKLQELRQDRNKCRENEQQEALEKHQALLELEGVRNAFEEASKRSMTNGDDASLQLAEIKAQFEREVESMKDQFNQQLESVKTHGDKKAEKLREQAMNATQEWNELDLSLQHERTEHLDSLRQLQELKSQMIEEGHEAETRIAELTGELEDKTQGMQELREQLEEMNKMFIVMKEKKVATDASEKLSTLDSLYSSTITKLLERVEGLEKRHHPAKRRVNNNNSTRSSTNNTTSTNRRTTRNIPTTRNNTNTNRAPSNSRTTSRNIPHTTNTRTSKSTTSRQAASRSRSVASSRRTNTAPVPNRTNPTATSKSRRNASSSHASSSRSRITPTKGLRSDKLFRSTKRLTRNLKQVNEPIMDSTTFMRSTNPIPKSLSRNARTTVVRIPRKKVNNFMRGPDMGATIGGTFPMLQKNKHISFSRR